VVIENEKLVDLQYNIVRFDWEINDKIYSYHVLSSNEIALL
jgi:hypothetical protein